MINKIVAACIYNRDFYDRVRTKLSVDAEAAIIMKELDDYYKTDSTTVASDVDVLREKIKLRLKDNPKACSRVLQEYSIILEQDVSALENIRKFVRDAKLSQIHDKLAEACAKSDRSELHIESILSERNSIIEEDGYQELFNSVDVGELSKTYSTGGIYFGPPELRSRLGYGVLPGHHYLIYGRPEIGKSLVAIDVSCDIIREGGTVLFCENEDPKESTIMRIICNLTGWTDAQVVASPDKARQLALRNGYERFFLASLSPGTLGQIEAFVRRLRPTACVVNQLRNLYVKGDTRTNMLEAAATGIRNIGKSHNCSMISVTQAGDSASGKRILTLGDVDSSNTGIPAAVDVMMGVGGDDQLNAMDMRVLSFPKNKLGKGPDSHKEIVVRVDRSLSRMIK
jgi:hypothetical protein